MFIPRPETEELVELVLRDVRLSRSEDPRVLEVGCGCGAVALSLLREGPRRLRRVTAVDRSRAACDLARENAAREEGAGRLAGRMDVVRARLMPDGTFRPSLPAAAGAAGAGAAGAGGGFDLVVSNPPYVPRSDLASLEPEVAVYEDPRALDGGPRGLDVIRAIVRFCSGRAGAGGGGGLSPGGRLYLEVDPSHRRLLPALLEEEGGHLAVVGFHRDFAGRHRFAVLERTAE